jgi:MFS family permease
VTRASPLAQVAAYSIDAVAYPDFFWVFVTRTFYYMGLSIQAFVLFMLRDVQKVSDPKYYTSMLAMVGQLAALLVAVPTGRLSDHLGRKPLVFASCAVMAVVYIGFAFSPNINMVIVLTIGWGMGNGMFLSVDYALACDVLPSLEHAAQSLGVWGVSAFLGSTLGPLIAGPLLTHFGSTTATDQYSTPGYVAVMLLGAVYVICAGLMLRTVRERVRAPG